MSSFLAKQLGEFLSAGRKQTGLTLREVETQAGVSNSYLSQLESGKIAEPSPAVLHRLTKLYGLSYAKALLLAGHPAPGMPATAENKLAARFSDITEKEAEELDGYLQFLRSRKRR